MKRRWIQFCRWSKPAELTGQLDVINSHRLAGWAWDKSNPSKRLSVVVRQGANIILELNASRHRSDLQAAGVGDGCHSFDVPLDLDLGNLQEHLVNVEIKGTDFRLPIAAGAMEEIIGECRLNVYNFTKLLSKPPARFGAIRFDPNNDCNLHCVYCHNQRSKEVISREAFDYFINQKVISIQEFQVGCIMEPTLSPNLADFFHSVAVSPARPKDLFILQTNGLLLHRHDHARMVDAGLNQLQVSLDTADPAIQRSIRDGMSLRKVIRNIEAFRKDCPDTKVVFMATITRENVDTTDNLVSLGMDIGVRDFVFREVFYHHDNDIIDHKRMPDLVLKPGQFSAMKLRLIDMFGLKGNFMFLDEINIKESEQLTISESF
jgi:sulfatase maturation enzyme AslB (radical SAM superfamily)